MNTPNTITLIRILMIPLVVFFYLADFIPYARLVAALLFIIACLTDFLDGYLARKQNKVTTLGKFFDTIADKMLIMTALILIIAVPVTGSTPVVYPSWLGVICIIIILAREFAISALRQLAASKGVILAADMGGKVKATVQYIVVFLYMVFAFVETDLVANMLNTTPIAIIRFVLMLLLIGATFLTIYSGAGYIIRNRKVFYEKKAEVASETTEQINNEIVTESIEEPKEGEKPKKTKKVNKQSN